MSNAKPGGEQQSPEPAEPGALDGLAAAVRAVYGDRLTEAQFRIVRDKLARTLEVSAALRRFPLHNGDEPDFVFAARREEG